MNDPRDDGESFPPPAETSPDASPSPLPAHDSLPAEMVGESKTDRAPADFNELRELMLKILDEQNAGFSLAFERIGEARLELARQARVQEAFAIHVDKRLDDIKAAALDSGNGSLAVTAAMNDLREALEQQVRHEVAKALDEHLPIERLAAAERR